MDDFVRSFEAEVAEALKFYGVPDVDRVARPIVAAIIAAYSDPSDGRRAALKALRDYDDSVIE